MIEQLISFETAKFAKEKGCNLEKCTCGGYYPDCICSDTRISQSLLAKWLREVHNIHFEIKPIFDVKDNLKPYHISVIKNPSGKDFEYEIVGSLDTYEEALEIGLQEALKLIK